MYFEGNDLNDLEIEINSKLLKNYLMDPKFSQNLKFKQKNIDKIILKKIEKEKEEVVKNFKVEFIKFIKLFNLREMIFFQTNINIKNQIRPNEDFFKIMSRVKNIAKENNSKIYFIYVPDYYRFVTKYDNSSYTEIKKLVNKLDIPFIDIKEEILLNNDNYKDFYPFGMSGHFNEYGYKLIAEKIYKYINLN